MRFSFGREYRPVHQEEMVEEPEDVERKKKVSPTDLKLQAKINLYISKHSASAAWIHWISWSLIPFLLFSNLYTWIQLKALMIDEAIFCRSKRG
jgi:hypothetical protein